MQRHYEAIEHARYISEETHVGHVQFTLLWLQRLQNLPSLSCLISLDKKQHYLLATGIIV